MRTIYFLVLLLSPFWAIGQKGSNLGNTTSQEGTGHEYSMTANGKSVEIKSFSHYCYASFDLANAAELTIKCTKPIETCEISPLSRTIKYQVKANQITFRLEKPGYFVVRINETEKLFVFAETPEVVPPKSVNILGYGVDNNGQKNQTELIQKAIDEAASKGKTLYFPKGIYTAGQICLRQNSQIHLSRGAVLQADTGSVEQYSSNDQVKTRRFIYIKNANNVKITGYGTINGNGEKLREKFGDEARMRLVMAINCKNLSIEEVTLMDPGSWNTQLLLCQDVVIRHVKLLNNTSLSNTDGFDPDASKKLLIEACFACCGDDNVAIKTTNYGDYLANAEDITIRGCVFLTKKSSLKVGTETRAESMRNILFEDNDVIESDRGMALYISDGTTFENIRFVNNRFERNFPDAKRAGFYFEINRRNPDSKAGKMNNILIKDCVFRSSFPRSSFIRGLDASHVIENVTIDNLIIDHKKVNNMKEAGIEINDFVSNLVLK